MFGRIMGKLNIAWLAIATIVLSALVFSAFSINSAHADNPNPATAQVKVQITSVLNLAFSNCTGSTSDNVVRLNITAANPAGTFTSCSTSLSVTTNHPSYKLSIQALDGDNQTTDIPYADGSTSDSGVHLVRVSNESATPPTLDTTNKISPHTGTIATPTAMIDSSTSVWGFAVPKAQIDTSGTANNFDSSYSIKSPTSDTTNLGNYAAIPVAATPIRSSTQTANGDVTNVFFGTRVKAAQIAGKYRASVVFTLVGEMCAYDASLPFDDEDCVEPTGEPAPPQAVKDKDTYIVPNFASTKAPEGDGTGTNGPQFSIYGSNFTATPTVTIGGQPCTDITINTARTAMTCTGPVSGMTDGEKRIVINGVDAGDEYTVFYSSYNFPTLQSLASATCAATPTVYRDARDSQLYYVNKLNDDKCWMLDNLRYKPNGDTTGTVTSGFSATQVANAGTTSMLTVNGSSSGGANYNAAKYIDPIINAYCYGKTNMPPASISKCGLLYNFFTATAGTAPNTQTSGNASGSICPANWHLSAGGTTALVGDFSVLDKAYPDVGTGSPHGDLTTQNLWTSTGAFAGVLAGAYSSSFSQPGNYGFYWTSSINTADVSFSINFNASTTVNPTSNVVSRERGMAVRCVIN